MFFPAEEGRHCLELGGERGSLFYVTTHQGPGPPTAGDFLPTYSLCSRHEENGESFVGPQVLSLGNQPLSCSCLLKEHVAKSLGTGEYCAGNPGGGGLGGWLQFGY